MNRLFTVVGTTVVAGLVVWAPPAAAQPDRALRGEDNPRRMARAALGLIEGNVVDDRGHPLPGVMVSALGATSTLAVTDRQGSFRFKDLPAGAYLLRAHLSGFAPSRREFVQVRPGAPARFSATLRRTATSEDPPALLSAGMGPVGDGPAVVEEAEAADSSEKAWRLRHLKRSILKETTERLVLAENEEPFDDSGGFSIIGRAMGSSAQFIADLPLSGQVNFLTSGSFDGAQQSVDSMTPLRGTAYVSIGGPAFSHGDWAARVMAQGDLGSWFVGGSYRKRAPSDHVFDIGVSYSVQRFTGGSLWPLSSGGDGSRSAGAIYGVDRWSLSPQVTLTYGGRFAHYDYIPEELFSPHVSLTLMPVDGLRVVGSASRRLLAPGAEEFLEPLASGLWIPPERTFVGRSPIDPESTAHYELSVERDVWRHVVVAVRAFLQDTRNQQVALFGGGPSRPPTGHYEVASTGDVDARGWSVGVSASPVAGTRGSIVYEMTDAQWLLGETSSKDVLLVGYGARPSRERLHDLTTSVETEISHTATTVFVTYKLNSGFARRSDTLNPGMDARFDVQVVQRLPFLDFTSARWQALVAVRNLFRDAAADASVYDELLVVHPPKRVVGGLLVRF